MPRVDTMASRFPVIAAVLMLAVCAPAQAGFTMFRGALTIRPAKGQIDLQTGSATIKVRRWDLQLSPASNGIVPDSEPVIIRFDQEQFLLPAGQMKVSKNGKRFSYKSLTERGIRELRLTRNADGTYAVRFQVAGVNLSTLVIQDPPLAKCLGFDVSIGDDQGLSGVTFERQKAPPSRRLAITGFCSEVENWPWA